MHDENLLHKVSDGKPKYPLQKGPWENIYEKTHHIDFALEDRKDISGLEDRKWKREYSRKGMLYGGWGR